MVWSLFLILLSVPNRLSWLFASVMFSLKKVQVRWEENKMCITHAYLWNAQIYLRNKDMHHICRFVQTLPCSKHEHLCTVLTTVTMLACKQRDSAKRGAAHLQHVGCDWAMQRVCCEWAMERWHVQTAWTVKNEVDGCDGGTQMQLGEVRETREAWHNGIPLVFWIPIGTCVDLLTPKGKNWYSVQGFNPSPQYH